MSVLAETNEAIFNDAGEIPVGFLFASVKNIGDTPVLVNGLSLPSGEAKSYPFVGKPHSALAFDTLNSSLQVMYIL